MPRLLGVPALLLVLGCTLAIPAARACAQNGEFPEDAYRSVGLMLSAHTGLALVSNEEADIGGDAVPAESPGATSGMAIELALDAPERWWSVLAWDFVQSPTMRIWGVTLGSRLAYPLDESRRWSLDFTLGIGWLRVEFNHEALASVFGETHSKATQSAGLAVGRCGLGWRPIEWIGLALTASWSQRVFRTDTWTAGGTDADLPQLDIQPGGFAVTLALRFYILSGG